MKIYTTEPPQTEPTFQVTLEQHGTFVKVKINGTSVAEIAEYKSGNKTTTSRPSMYITDQADIMLHQVRNYSRKVGLVARAWED